MNGGRPLQIRVVGVKAFAMIREDDDQGIVVPPRLLQLVDHDSQLGVGLGEQRVVQRLGVPPRAGVSHRFAGGDGIGLSVPIVTSEKLEARS